MKSSNEQQRPLFQTVTDDKGYSHQLTEKLGQGGQGAVFRTMDRNVVIKALVDEFTGEIIRDRARYESFKSDIDEVRTLSFPEGIHIAKPVYLLKSPACGYIMRLLSDMVPIRSLILVPKDQSLGEFYIQTGGLRRRLRLLAETARILSRLHSLPVVYADISPENVFVSQDVKAMEVWLIDSDNLRYTVDFQRTIYTPGYAAPEIIQRKNSNNTLSDVYSFALLAFETLALLSPFDGELVVNGSGWDDGEQDYAAMAERGELPWVEDAEDDSNFSERGIPRNMILSDNLKELFQATFGRQGREDPASRPGMRKWYEVLRQAFDATVTCPECGATFYIGNNKCPFCDHVRSKVCLAQVFERFLTEDEEGNQHEHYSKGVIKIFDLDNEEQHLYSYHTGDMLMHDIPEETVELRFGKVCTLRNLTPNSMAITHNGTMKTLPTLGLFDCADLDGALLHIPIHETRTRHISFRMI